MFRTMTQWLKLRQEGRNIGEALAKKGYRHVAIYGMGAVGERLLRELKDTDVVVDYGIDRRARVLRADMDVCLPEEELKPVDAIVVTALGDFDEIEDMLSKRMDCPILALDDLMYMC